MVSRVCPFCDLIKYESDKAFQRHVITVMCNAFVCDECERLCSFCPHHVKQKDRFPSKDEFDCIRVWNSHYAKFAAEQATFDNRQDCSFCKKLIRCGLQPLPEDASAKKKTPEEHIRHHLQYYTSADQLSGATLTDVTIIRPIRKLDQLLQMLLTELNNPTTNSEKEKQATGDISHAMTNADTEAHGHYAAEDAAANTTVDSEPIAMDDSPVTLTPETATAEPIATESIDSNAPVVKTTTMQEAIERAKHCKVVLEMLPKSALDKARIIRDPNLIVNRLPARSQLSLLVKKKKKKAAVVLNVPEVLTPPEDDTSVSAQCASRH